MASSISNVIYDPCVYVLAGIFVSSIVVIKIVNACEPIFKKYYQKFNSISFVVNIKSLFCKDCARLHSNHRLTDRISKYNQQFIVNDTDLSNRNVRRIPTPIPDLSYD